MNPETTSMGVDSDDGGLRSSANFVPQPDVIRSHQQEPQRHQNYIQIALSPNHLFFPVFKYFSFYLSQISQLTILLLVDILLVYYMLGVSHYIYMCVSYVCVCVSLVSGVVYILTIYNILHAYISHFLTVWRWCPFIYIKLRKCVGYNVLGLDLLVWFNNKFFFCPVNGRQKRKGELKMKKQSNGAEKA